MEIRPSASVGQSDRPKPANEGDLIFDPNDKSPEHQKRVYEHLAIVKELESPARGSEDFEKIKALIRQAKLGPVEFKTAYVAAWEAGRYQPERFMAGRGEIDEKPFDTNNPLHVAALKEMCESWRSSEFAALEAVFGKTNGELISNIFKISPRIPFSDPTKAGRVPQLSPGTVLLKPEDYSY